LFTVLLCHGESKKEAPMPIAIKPRKNVLAARLAAERPELTRREVGKIVGLAPSAVQKAIVADHFGKDKPKSPAKA
jgi:hypothetical protein